MLSNEAFSIVSGLLLGFTLAMSVMYLIMRYDDKLDKAIRWFEKNAKRGRK